MQSCPFWQMVAAFISGIITEGVWPGKQTQLGATHSSPLCILCMGHRLGKNAWEEIGTLCPVSMRPGYMTLSTSLPASVSPHSLKRMVLTFAENFNVHRKLFTYIIASNLHITKFGKTKFKNKPFYQSSTFMLLRPFHIYASDGSS